MRPNDIIKLKIFVNYWRASVTCLAYPVWVFFNHNWLHCITAKICLVFGFFNFELTQRKTPCDAELCASFQNCSPIKQLCLDLDLSEKSCLASILLLRFLESCAKECSKSVKSSSEIAENQSFWPIFCVKRKRSWYWNGWGTTIFRLT